MTAKIIAGLFARKKKYSLDINIHQVLLRFHCDRKFLLNDFRKYLQYFHEQPARRVESTTSCIITVLNKKEYEAASKLHVPQKYFEAFPGVRASYGDLDKYSIYEIKSSCLIIIDNESNDCACVIKSSNNERIIKSDLVIHVLLIEWLRGRGLFFIHSSGICHRSKGYLFIGQSGAGKTTTALMGVQRGFSFMGDDLLILKERAGKLYVHSYIEDVKFCLDMTRKFDELNKLRQVTEQGNRKPQALKFDVKKYFKKAKIADKATVSKIFFLNKSNAITKIKPNEALPLLMNNSFFYSRADTSLRHFDLLCQLAYSADSYLVGRSYINRHVEKLLEQSEKKRRGARVEEVT